MPIAVPPPGSAYRKDADAFAGPLRLGFIARTCPEWGLRLVLEAWRRLKPDPSEAILDIYTSKEFEDEGWGKGIADLIERGSVTVSLEPVFDRLDEVHAPLGGMIVASQWKNNMSGAGLEGLVRGTPVITSDRHAFYESLAPEMQELAYRFGDVRSLVEVLGRVIADPGLLEARSGASAPAVEEHHHVRGVAEALRAAHAVGPGPAPAVPIQIDRPGALLIARGDWAEVLDQYLAGAVAIPRGDLVVVAPFVDALAVEETVLERLARAGLDPETCPRSRSSRRSTRTPRSQVRASSWPGPTATASRSRAPATSPCSSSTRRPGSAPDGRPRVVRGALRRHGRALARRAAVGVRAPPSRPQRGMQRSGAGSSTSGGAGPACHSANRGRSGARLAGDGSSAPGRRERRRPGC